MNPNGDDYKEGNCHEERYDSGALTVRRTLLSISTMCDWHVCLRTLAFSWKSLLALQQLFSQNSLAVQDLRESFLNGNTHHKSLTNSK